MIGSARRSSDIWWPVRNNGRTALNRADADDLFAHFLIDVEMCSCQLTSRIKQAIGSVQLFAQRCLMGLEPRRSDRRSRMGAVEDLDENYRVWEANRKIWLYPENWIEPELRDDKTPFFKELESELLQSDLDDAAAEQALLHYLEKLDRGRRVWRSSASLKTRTSTPARIRPNLPRAAHLLLSSAATARPNLDALGKWSSSTSKATI